MNDEGIALKTYKILGSIVDVLILSATIKIT